MIKPVGPSFDPTAVNPSFVADVEGSYTATLIVNDGALDSGPDTVAITATLGPPPVNTPMRMDPPRVVFPNACRSAAQEPIVGLRRPELGQLLVDERLPGGLTGQEMGARQIAGRLR